MLDPGSPGQVVDLKMNGVQHQRGQHDEGDVLRDELEPQSVGALPDVREPGADLGEEIDGGAAHEHRATGECHPQATDA